MESRKCEVCGEEAYAYVVTAFGKDSVCKVCIGQYTGITQAFIPFVPWSPTSENSGGAKNSTQQAKCKT